MESPSRTLAANENQFPIMERRKKGNALVTEHKVSRVSGAEEDAAGVSSFGLRNRVLRERGGRRPVAELQDACTNRRCQW